MTTTLLQATTASHFVTNVSEIVTTVPESRFGLCVSLPCHKIGNILLLIYFFLSGAMATPSVTSLAIESIVFPPIMKAPGSTNNFFLGGAGVRGIQIQDKFVKFTAIGVYLQDIAIPYLAAKWKGKPPHKLTESVPFFMDIVTGPFEKFMRVTMIKPLTGQEYSNKVSENCVAIWKSLGIYTDEEAKAIDKFVSVFKDETFPPGSSILFTVSPKGLGSLTISFSKDGSIPEVEAAVIENKLLSQAVLESMIGAHGVSPAAKQSLASRLSELFKEEDEGSVLQ